MMKNYDYTINMNSLLDDRLDDIRSFYSREDFEKVIKAVKEAPEDAKLFRQRDLDRLCDDRDIYLEDFDSVEEFLYAIPTREEMQEELLDTFYELYQKTPSPKKIMERIVRTLAPEFGKDTVEDAILKKFQEELGTGIGKLKPGEMQKLSHDLAEGNFRCNGKTMVYLYYFAFVFGMTLPVNGKEIVPERNLEKNLFHDYYNDNLLRLLEGEYSLGSTAVEKEPTGEGINYKNYVQAIYLYFLCRDDLDMNPGEKISKAEEIIDCCIKKAKTKKDDSEKGKKHYTEWYREILLDELLSLEMEEIPDFIVQNYNVKPPKQGITRIMVDSEEKSALEEIRRTIEEQEEDFGSMKWIDRAEFQNLSKTQMKRKEWENSPWKINRILKERYADDKGFLQVLEALDRRVRPDYGRYSSDMRRLLVALLRILAKCSDEENTLSKYQIIKQLEREKALFEGYSWSESIKTLKAIGYDIRKSGDRFYLGNRDYEEDMQIMLNMVMRGISSTEEERDNQIARLLVMRLKENKRVTRNELIVMHFNYYLLLLVDDMETMSFPEVFSEYKSIIDPILISARYQPLSCKNIFDMYIVLALYFYILENTSCEEE